MISELKETHQTTFQPLDDLYYLSKYTFEISKYTVVELLLYNDIYNEGERVCFYKVRDENGYMGTIGGECGYETDDEHQRIFHTLEECIKYILKSKREKLLCH